MKKTLLVLAALLSGCATTTHSDKISLSGDVRLLLIPETSVRDYCTAIASNPIPGSCVVVDQEEGKRICTVIAPIPEGVGERNAKYYIGAAVYQCLTHKKDTR